MFLRVIHHIRIVSCHWIIEYLPKNRQNLSIQTKEYDPAKTDDNRLAYLYDIITPTFECDEMMKLAEDAINNYG